MKHLKLFENKRQTFWLMEYYIRSEDMHTYELHSNKESVELAILEIINREKADAIGDEEYDKIYFTEVEEALNWFNGWDDDTEISYTLLKLEESLKVSEELQKARDIKKYNL